MSITPNFASLNSRTKLLALLYFIFALLMFCVIGIFIYSRFVPKGDEYVVFLIVSAALLILSFFQGRVLYRNNVALAETVAGALTKTNEDLTSTIKKYLEPSIWTLLTNNSVIEHASKALKEASEGRTSEDKFVYIFGAAALSTSRANNIETETTDPAATYRNALAELARTHTSVDRYINLFDDPAFKSRSETIQAGYIDWLNRQLALMKENAAYRLWHTIRAGEWGSARSTIVTQHHVLDVVGDGISGFFITGRDVAHLVRTQTIKHIQAAKMNPPELHDATKLSEYRDRLLSLYKQTAKSSQTKKPVNR